MEKAAHNRIERAPVVVIMGHIDHGKSTLLDYIRKTNVVESEAGGITQHISSYEVTHKDETGRDRRITFLDTPGHEAFSQMRLRGAGVADIAILIVSAEDGVKAQTLEALDAIKKAGIPFIVAINKIDRPNADVDRTKTSLIENEIYLEGLGGDIPYALTSAKTGDGVSELLDLLLLAADLQELTGDPKINAEGIVIESNIDKKKGISATLIIKNGALKSGMYVLAGSSIAPVRIMEDFTGKKIKEARFSSPIRLIGFDSVPQVGQSFISFEKKKDAEKAALEYTASKRKQKAKADATLNDEEDPVTLIPIIIKTDVLGSVDAIKHEIEKITVPDHVELKIVHEGAGSISESDVKVAGGNQNTIILGFNVSVDERARSIAERSGIEIETSNIIYELAEWLEGAIKARTPKLKTVEVTGRAKVLKTFSKVKNKQVIGARVEDGTIRLSGHVRIMRKDEEIGDGNITNLQSQKAAVRDVSAVNECGLEVNSKAEIAPGDILEAFVITEK